jgi:hypothetical protein
VTIGGACQERLDSKVVTPFGVCCWIAWQAFYPRFSVPRQKLIDA